MSSPRIVLQEQLRFGMEYLEQLIQLFATADLYNYSPSEESRSVSEILLHIIRSLEYYIRGVNEDKWEFLPYTPDKYESLEKISELVSTNKQRLQWMISSLDGDKMHHLYTALEKPAFGLSLMIETLYHQSEHFGQLQVYLRLNGIQPPTYKFLV